MMPDQNPIYDFMKSNKLTDLDEKTFLNKYSAPEKAKEVHSFFVENNLTDLDSANFYDKYLKKKDQVSPSVSSPTKSQSVLPDFEKGRAFAEKGFLMQGEGTKTPKPEKRISFEPSFNIAAPFEVKVLEEGEEPSLASDLMIAGARGQIQGKVANLLPAGKVPTNEELGEIAQLQTDAKLLPQSKAEKAYQEKGLKGLFSESPLLGAQFVGETMLSSLASLAQASSRTLPTAIAAGAGAGAAFGGIGALPGAAMGMLAGQSAAGYNLSTSQDILNSLSENGVDISNKESLIKAFSDENKMAKIRTTAAKYGVPILLFDAATAGLAGKLATGAMGKSLSRKLLAGLGEAGIQMTGGAGGELAGQIASGKKVNWDDVAVEAIAEVPGGAVEVATGIALERSKSSSNNNTLATQIATQGPEDGTKDAVLNLNRDLANNVITPEQHQEGMNFVEKAVQVSSKIPETVTGESKAKSIELLVERNDIKENNQILEQQKQATDEAYHAGIDEEIKANEEKIKKIDSEVYNIAKNPVKEKSVVQISEPTEEIPVVEEYDLKNGDIITANIGGKKEKGRVTGVGRNKGEIVIDFIDENNNERFVYGNQIENIEKGQAEIDNLSKAQKERKAELLNKEELTQDELDELDKLNKAKAEVKQIEEVKPTEVKEEPLKENEYYHATDATEILAPSDKGYKKREGANVVGEGIYFGKDKEHLTDRFGKNAIKAELDIKNPLITDNVYVIVDGREIDMRSLSKEDIDFLKGKGYDAIKYVSADRAYSNWDETVVFDKSQIKVKEEVKPTEVKVTEEVNPTEVEETANALKSFDKIIKGTKTAGTEVYHKAIDLINEKKTHKFTGKGWEDVAEAYHKALKNGKNPELVELIDKTLVKENAKVEKPTEVNKSEANKLTQDDLKKAEAKFATAKDRFEKAKAKVEASQVTQRGMFGGEQKGMFAMGGEEAKSTLDPLRIATKEAKAELDDIRNRIKVQEEAQQELKPVEEAPKKTYQEALKEKQEAEKKRNREVGAEKAAITKELKKEANKIEISDARSAALNYLSGANLSEEAINEVSGRVKRARLNTGEREFKSEEARARDYVAKKGEGESLDAAAHSIWDNLSDEMQSKMDTQEVKEALMQAIMENKTKAEALKSLIDGYKEESLEDQEAEFYRRYNITEDEIEAELALAEESLELDGSDEYDFDLPEEHINNLIEQYEAEAKNKIEQPAEGGKEKGAEKISAREVSESEAKLVDEYREAVKKAGKKARENAKNEFVNRNFNLIKEKLKIEIKCPT